MGAQQSTEAEESGESGVPDAVASPSAAVGVLSQALHLLKLQIISPA